MRQKPRCDYAHIFAKSFRLEQFVTFTATVTSQGSGTPTGTVTLPMAHNLGNAEL